MLGAVIEITSCALLIRSLALRSLYGFGNNHPFNRKVQKPIVGNLSIDSLVDSFSAENLMTRFNQEDVSISGYFFDIVFSNQANVKKFGVKVNNARLDSYSLGLYHSHSIEKLS